MSLFTLAQLEAAVPLVRTVVPPTPLYAWPLLAKRTGAQVWVKHENHTPIGAFKVRGGIVYLDALKRSGVALEGVVTATRGNHGQSIGFAARQRRYHYVPSFHAELVKGVATYALEMFTAQPDLEAVYAPIGMGSGICGLITVRDLLGLDTEIIGVVADNAPAVALSFEQGRPVPTNSANTFADGMACRVPHEESLAIIQRGAERVVRVREDEIAEAMRACFEDTHNVAEGAGAAALAALLRERDRMAGKRVGLVLSGGNIDREMFAEVLAGRTPEA